MNLMVSICERDHLFCLLSSSKMEFCCNNCILLHFVFCSIPFLVFKIQITVVQKSTKKCFCNKPHSCKSPPKMVATGPGLIFGVLRYALTLELSKVCIYLTRGWLRGWYLFILAGKFVSPVQILYWKKMWIQGTYGDVWYHCYIAKICFFNIDLFILSTFPALTLAFLYCYVVSQV